MASTEQPPPHLPVRITGVSRLAPHTSRAGPPQWHSQTGNSTETMRPDHKQNMFKGREAKWGRRAPKCVILWPCGLPNFRFQSGMQPELRPNVFGAILDCEASRFYGTVLLDTRLAMIRGEKRASRVVYKDVYMWYTSADREGRDPVFVSQGSRNVWSIGVGIEQRLQSSETDAN